MPIVQYVNQFKGINRTANMPTPKRMTEIRRWLKEAQRACREIPQEVAESEAMANSSIGSDGWFVLDTEVSVDWVKFTIENRIGEKAHIVINRRANGFER